jgi:hypothetical protein
LEYNKPLYDPAVSLYKYILQTLHYELICISPFVLYYTRDPKDDFERHEWILKGKTEKQLTL